MTNRDKLDASVAKDIEALIADAEAALEETK